MANSSCSSSTEYTGLTPEQYSKNFCIGGIMAIIIGAIAVAYCMGITAYPQYLIPPTAITMIALASIIALSTDTESRFKAAMATVMLSVIVLTPVYLQHIIRQDMPNIMTPTTFYINDNVIEATPHRIVKNYWSSDALYANIVNTIYDHRSLSVTLNDGHTTPINLKVHVNDYADHDTMKKIVQQTFDN